MDSEKKTDNVEEKKDVTPEELKEKAEQFKNEANVFFKSKLGSRCFFSFIFFF